MSAHNLTMAMIREVLYTTGITATAGIGTNLYLAKLAMDITAKHAAPDKALAALSAVDPQFLGKLISLTLLQLICKGQAGQGLEFVTPKSHYALPEVHFAGILLQCNHSSVAALSLCPRTDILCFSSFREVHTFCIRQIRGHGGTGQLQGRHDGALRFLFQSA